MQNYLWVIVLSSLSLVSLLVFLISFSKDHFYIKKLKRSSANYFLNFSLLVLSIADVVLVIYLFQLLKQQLGLFV